MLDTFLERFWSKVQKTSGCWLWTAALNNMGYGRIGRNGAIVLAHRMSFEIATGNPPPSGLDVLHSCDTPNCVRPDHLFVGTAGDNIQDALSKGRMRRRPDGKMERGPNAPKVKNGEL